MAKHDIGKKIKALRLKYCWTQVECANRLRISRRTLIGLENGTNRGEPRPLTLAKIVMSIRSLEKAV